MILSSVPSQPSSNEMVNPHVIPPCDVSAPAPRTLVLCFDGTGDEFDSDNSNVVKFCSLLERDEHSQQMVYYQAGLGTYTTPRFVTSLGRGISKTMDKVFAWNLASHVLDGYNFLMQNYETGDKICLFGFSRGAYTARALAGMLHKVGLLPPWNYQQVQFAYKMYRRTDKTGWDQSSKFKAHFSRAVNIDFIGVWDTVCSVGLVPQRLPFTASNTAIRVFRHAVSLDEHRAKFEVNYCHYHPNLTPTVESTAASGTTHSTTTASTVKNADNAAEIEGRRTMEKSPDNLGEGMDKTTETGASKNCLNQAMHWVKSIMMNKDHQLAQDEKQFNETESKLGTTNVKEVWFAGCHSDVGGGSEKNDQVHSLARISLRWMICETFRTGTGIRFRADLLKEIGLEPDPFQPQAEPKVIKEEECKDAKSVIHDQLRKNWLWWIVELLPTRPANSKHGWDFRVNLGRGRTVVPAPGAKEFYIHHTVEMREKADDLIKGRYKPKATWKGLQPNYVH